MRVEDFRALVATRLLGIWDVDDAALEKLARHHELFDRWNLRNDRTAVRDTGEAVERHYCEGIFVATHVPRGSQVIADLGSGLGFPGAIIAAILPTVTVHLVESNLDKALFLRDSTRGWPNVKVRSARVQNLPDKFEMVVARGFPLAEYKTCGPVLSSVGLCVGSRAEAQIIGSEDFEPIPWANKGIIRSTWNMPVLS